MPLLFFYGGNMKVIIIIYLFILNAYSSEKDIEEACRTYAATDCNLVKAISWVESRFKNVHVMDGDSMSYGVMQVKCVAARDAGLKYSCEQLRKKKIGLRFGILYLEQKLTKYKDIEQAIVSYNSYKPIVCTKYNPGKCYPGEYINQDYLIKVIRYYNYIKKENAWKDLGLSIQMQKETNDQRVYYTRPCIIYQERSPAYHKIMMSLKF